LGGSVDPDGAGNRPRIDNVIFLSVLVSRMPQAQAEACPANRAGARTGVPHSLLAFWCGLIGFTEVLFTWRVRHFSWRDIILIGGGLFLIAKSDSRNSTPRWRFPTKRATTQRTNVFFWMIVQIIAIDMLFSLDSIITAIGMAQDIEIMIAP